ncbi:MAG: 16S rRNA (uracil(1498)-N(3))-methyltransferase [Acidimicrobiales bacterium]
MTSGLSGPATADARAHAFVADLEAPDLDEVDRHHFERVLRLRPGDPITVGDGQGGWRTCRLGPIVEPVSELVVEAPSSPVLTVAFALVKGERPEWIVQKLTELGIDRIVPFTAARSVIRWDGERVAHHHVRAVAVARAAAMQSRRAWLPDVDPVADFNDVATLGGAALADRDGGPPTLNHFTMLVGPEGGWSPAERSSGLPVVRLGTGVLRAETAAVAAGAVLTALRAGLVGPRTAHDYGPC